MRKNIGMNIGDIKMIDDTVKAQSKEIEQRLLSRIKNPKEKALVEGHFRKLEEIRAKYSQKDGSPPEGLDGGWPEEKREIKEEEKRFTEAWKPYLEKH